MKTPLRRFIVLSALYSVLMLTLAVFGVAHWRLTKADRAIEQRLIGKWQVWYANYDPSQPPDRVIEWKSNGQCAHYSPTLEPRGSTQDLPDVTSNWFVRGGRLVTEMKHTSLSPNNSRDWTELNWESDDAVTFVVHAADGQTARLHYRRQTTDPKRPEEP